MPKLLIAASGTGGHLFPAIAVAKKLPKSWQTIWLGVPDRMETKLVPNEYPLFTINAGGLQGRGLRKLLQLLKLIASTKNVYELIKREKVEVIFTTGGYIAAPAILAARICGISVLLHESNAVPGKVTRLLGRFCTVVAIGLPILKKDIPGCKPIHTGTPIRSEFLYPQKLPDWVPKGSNRLIVIIGGSQGAVGLNLMMRGSLPSLLKKGYRVIHLTGEKDIEAKQLSHQNLIVKEFTNEMPGLLQHADLAISRAGSGSLNELAICGTPTIFVPFPQATDQHQEANACCAAKLGGAVIVHQHTPEDRTLEKVVMRLLNGKISNDNDIDPLIEMKQGMNELAVREASVKIIKLLENIR